MRIKTAADAVKIVARAEDAGWTMGRICDAIGVTPEAIRAWRRDPDRVPHTRVRAALLTLDGKLRRKG